jgi:transposase-like protein
MRAESVAKSIKMLKGILDGKTYVAVAREYGVSRSAVEQRVKALARDLQTVVGVERVLTGEPRWRGASAARDASQATATAFRAVFRLDNAGPGRHIAGPAARSHTLARRLRRQEYQSLIFKHFAHDLLRHVFTS